MLQIFSGRGRNGERLFLPRAYRRTVKWTPQIGDIFPNFEATTTRGRIRLFDWADGHWSFLFSHSAAFTPVCTTEIVSLAAALPAFEARNTRLLSVSASPVRVQQSWFDEIAEIFDVEVGFPGVEDLSGHFGLAFGMVHPKESPVCPIRKSFVLDPQMRIRMIFEYPMFVGRSTEEVLRCLDALQAQQAHGVATPADWMPGDQFLVFDAAAARPPDGMQITAVTDYLTVMHPAPANAARAPAS